MRSRPPRTPVESADVGAAARQLAGRVVRTPVIRADALLETAGSRLWLKAENLQRAGSYKVRGALLAVDRVAREGRHRRVLTQSSGNHGIAVAMAARECGLPATVVLPMDAAQVKVNQIRSYGAEVIQPAPMFEDCRPAILELLATDRYEYIDLHGDSDLVAGQGTASLELLEDVPGLDALIVPVAGGSGLAGAVLAARATGQDVAIYGVEPSGCGSLARSLQAGERITVEAVPGLVDALTSRQPGALPFGIFRDSVAGAIAIDDDAVIHAFGLALFSLKLLLEPAGVIGLAAALTAAIRDRYRNIGVLLTGGNVAAATAADLVAAYLEGTGHHG